MRSVRPSRGGIADVRSFQALERYSVHTKHAVFDVWRDRKGRKGRSWSVYGDFLEMDPLSMYKGLILN